MTAPVVSTVLGNNIIVGTVKSMYFLFSINMCFLSVILIFLCTFFSEQFGTLCMDPNLNPNDPRIRGCPICPTPEPCVCQETAPCTTPTESITSTLPPYRHIPAPCYANDCRPWIPILCTLDVFKQLYPDLYNGTEKLSDLKDCRPRVIHIKEK